MANTKNSQKPKKTLISMATKEKKEKPAIQNLPNTIPDFNILVRTSSRGVKVNWFKVHSSPFINKVLRRHRLRPLSSQKPIIHDHIVGSCDPVLFHTQSLKSETPLYYCEEPSTMSKCASVGNTIYCVGGNRDILGYPDIMAERFSQPPKPDECLNPVKFDSNLYLRILTNLNLSHMMIQCDFSQGKDGKGKDDDTNTWTYVGTPLITPRYYPKLLSFGGKVYLFGCNRPPSCEKERKRVPFAEVFDPKLGQSFALPEPPFPRIGVFHMVLVPLLGDEGEEKIILMSKACNPVPAAGVMQVYDVHDQSWVEFDDPEDNLFFNLDEIIGEAVPVAEQNTTYWIRGKTLPIRKMTISCYDWKTCKIFECDSSFLDDCLNIPEKIALLLHVHGELFYFIWSEFIPKSTQMHFALLQLSKNFSSARLDARLLGCYSCVLHDKQDLIFARLLWK